MMKATFCGQPQGMFTVTVTKPEHGVFEIMPALPAGGMLPAGSVITVAATPAYGFAVDGVFDTIPGAFGRKACETDSDPRLQ
jgi:hypothetical protein